MIYSTPMRPRRTAWLLGIAAASCGLDLRGTGSADAPATTEAGPPDATDDATDATGDATDGTYCQRALAAEPTIRFCADFDDGNAQPPFGFTGADTVDSGAFAIGQSPFERTGGALEVSLKDGGVTRSQRVKQHVAELSTAESRHITVDFDLVVREASLPSAVIAAIETLGGSCRRDFRIALQPDGLQVAGTRLPLELGTPYHVRIVGDVTQGKDATFTTTIGDASVPEHTVSIDKECNTGWVDLGLFYSSQSAGEAAIAIDHVIMRVR